jgi:hypothetical protein
MKIYDITKPKVVHDLNHHELKLVEERKVACYFFSLDMLERKKTPKFTLSLGLLLSLPNNLSFSGICKLRKFLLKLSMMKC